MNRFFIDPELLQGNTVSIPDDVSAQIRKVLRLREGAEVHFLDGKGWIYKSTIHYLDEKHISAEIFDKQPGAGEPSCRITLFIALTQREKFEWILQKCTEAGVSEIVPIITERSLIRKFSEVNTKQDRWGKILKEASEQCGRTFIPRLSVPKTFHEAINAGKNYDASLFCWESEKQNTLHDILDPIRHTVKSISIMIGPEGGFSDKEVSLILEKNWNPVTLGKRIFRMETAAVISVVLTLYEINDL